MSQSPKRIQRKRTKGWRMPPNTVYVGRPTKWGNPFRAGMYRQATHTPDGEMVEEFMPVKQFREVARRWAVHDYLAELFAGHIVSTEELEELRGKDLACWCRLCEKHKQGLPLGVECHDCAPCHVNVLLELANR